MSISKKIGITIDTNFAKATADVDKFAASTDKAAASSKKVSDTTKGTSESMEKLEKGVTMTAAAVVAVALAFDKASDRSLKFQAAQAQMTVGIGQARAAAQGLITDFDLMRLSNEAVRDGLVTNEAEFAKLANVATRLGLSVGKNATESTELFSNALDKLNARSLDSLGLAIDQDEAYFNYGVSVGKAADQLTEAEQKQALMSAAFEDAEKKLHGLNVEADKGALTFQQFKVELINLADQGFVYATGKIGDASDALASFLEDVADFNTTYGLDGRGGLDDPAYFRRVTQRGMAGVPGAQGEAARAESRRVEASKESLAVMEQSNRDMRLSISMLEANATANDKVTEALKKSSKAHKEKIDLFKAERAEFQSQFGEVEMGRAGTGLRTSMDREKFGRELDSAKFSEAGRNSQKAQLEFEKQQAEERANLAKAELDLQREMAEGTKRYEEQKRQAIEETMRSRQQTADALGALTSQSVAIADFGAEAMIRGEKRRESARKALAGSELIVIGIVETVKAAAAFAGFNYVEGALHTGAAALAFAKGGQLLSQAGSSGGGGAFGGGTGFGSGSSFGGGEAANGPANGAANGPSGPTAPISEMDRQRSGRGGMHGGGGGKNDSPSRSYHITVIGKMSNQDVINLRRQFDESERITRRVSSK